MSGANHLAWFASTWRDVQKRFRVMGEYHALGNSPYLLADIALRGHVFHSGPPAGNPCTDAWNAGRRSLALEILELARTDPNELFDLVERFSKRE